MNRRGFTLMEIMLTIILVGALMVEAGYAIDAAIKATHSAAQTQDLMAKFDSAMSQLRRDVWSAKEMNTPDTRSALLVEGNGEFITWQCAADGSLTRSMRKNDSSASRHWDEVGGLIAFQTGGTELTVAAPSGAKGIVVIPRTMCSQIGLAGRFRAAEGSQP